MILGLILGYILGVISALTIITLFIYYKTKDLMW